MPLSPCQPRPRSSTPSQPPKNENRNSDKHYPTAKIKSSPSEQAMQKLHFVVLVFKFQLDPPPTPLPAAPTVIYYRYACSKVLQPFFATYLLHIEPLPSPVIQLPPTGLINELAHSTAVRFCHPKNGWYMACANRLFNILLMTRVKVTLL